MDLYDRQGHRLYLTQSEREAFLDAAKTAPRAVRTFCLVLAYTGCRISEALSLTPESIDFADKAIVFETLKKRRLGVYRAVPVPEDVLDALNMVHGLTEATGRPKKAMAAKPLWDWSRMTAFRRVKEVMNAAKITEGPHKSPKGLRHGFGVHAISEKVPLNMLKKWMGHASLEITEIYANAQGQEERKIAAWMWE